MSELNELSVERVIALALMHGMRHASGPAQAADVIATALREAGWMVVRAEPDGTATVREWSLHDWRLGAREAMNNEQMARRLVSNYEKVQHRTVGPWRDA